MKLNVRLGLVKILKFRLSRDVDVWLRFWSWGLVDIQKTKFDRDLCENHSTLGFVVPLPIIYCYTFRTHGKTSWSKVTNFQLLSDGLRPAIRMWCVVPFYMVCGGILSDVWFNKWCHQWRLAVRWCHYCRRKTLAVYCSTLLPVYTFYLLLCLKFNIGSDRILKCVALISTRHYLQIVLDTKNTKRKIIKWLEL